MWEHLGKWSPYVWDCQEERSSHQQLRKARKDPAKLLAPWKSKMPRNSKGNLRYSWPVFVRRIKEGQGGRRGRSEQKSLGW